MFQLHHFLLGILCFLFELDRFNFNLVEFDLLNHRGLDRLNRNFIDRLRRFFNDKLRRRFDELEIRCHLLLFDTKITGWNFSSRAFHFNLFNKVLRFLHLGLYLSHFPVAIGRSSKSWCGMLVDQDVCGAINFNDLLSW